MRAATIRDDLRAPTPWGTGLLVTVLSAALTVLAVVTFGVALAAVNPVIAVVVNLVAVGGVAPTLLRWRAVPVMRWVIYGIGPGVLLGWLCLLLVLIAGR